MTSNEAIREGNFVEHNGEIVHPHDVGIFEESLLTGDEHQEAALAAYEEEQRAIDAIRGSADFSARNRHLQELASKVSKANQHQGAARSIDGGRYVPRYNSAEHAERLAARALDWAHELGQRACESCPLVNYCPIAEKPDKLVRALRDAKVRDRFKNRVEVEDNNRFCETNMKPGRLDKNEA